MRWPWMSKKKHDTEVTRLTGLLDEAIAQRMGATAALERERAKYPRLRFGREPDGHSYGRCRL